MEPTGFFGERNCYSFEERSSRTRIQCFGAQALFLQSVVEETFAAVLPPANHIGGGTGLDPISTVLQLAGAVMDPTSTILETACVF